MECLLTKKRLYQQAREAIRSGILEANLIGVTWELRIVISCNVQKRITNRCWQVCMYVWIRIIAQSSVLKAQRILIVMRRNWFIFLKYERKFICK